MTLTTNDLFKPRGRRREWPSLIEMVDATGICWEWLGHTDKDGYGAVRSEGRIRKAHRIFYEVLVGEIQENLVIDHLCRNPKCVFPDHLEAVTQKVNLHRGFSTSTKNRLKTLCKRGHAFDEKNTHLRITKNGFIQRSCRSCNRNKSYLRYHANKNLLPL